MASLRRFAFFDREAVRCPALACLDITCGTSGRGSIVLGDADGHIVYVDRDFKATATRAFKQRVNAVHQCRSSDYLVAIGDGLDSRPPAARAAGRVAVASARDRLRKTMERERAAASSGGAASRSQRRGTEEEASGDGGEEGEEGGGAEGDIGLAMGLGVPLEGSGGRGGSDGPPSATIKVWRLDRRNGATGLPELVRTARLFLPASKQQEKAITALCVSEDMGQLVVGCADGTLLLLRSDWTRERGSGSAVKYQLLQEAQPLPPSVSSASPAGEASGNPESVSFLAFAIQSRHTAAAAAAAEAAAAAAASAAVASGGTATGGVLAPLASGASALGRQLGKAAVSGTAGAAVATAAAVRRGFSAGGRGVAGGGGRGSSTSSPSPLVTTAASASGRAGSGGEGGMLCLFHVSPAKVRCWFTTATRPLGMGRGWSPSDCCVLLDEAGAEPGRACLNDAGELTIGNDAGVFFYSSEERRAAYAFPGRKQRVAFFRSYLLVASEEGGPGAGGSAGGATAAGGGGLGGGAAPGGLPLSALSSSSSSGMNAASTALAVAGGLGGGAVRVVLNVYDLRARFIAYSVALLPGGAGGAGQGMAGQQSSSAAGAASGQSGPIGGSVGGPSGGIGLFGRRMGGLGGGGSGGGPSGLVQGAPPTPLVQSSALPPQGVRFLFGEWGSVFVFVSSPTAGQGAGPSGSRFGVPEGGGAPQSQSSLGGAGPGGAPSSVPLLPLTVFSLSEKDTATKLETLCRMQLFDTAAAVAAAAQYGGREAIVDIYRRHGDALYGKGDYEGAVGQYIRTLDDGGGGASSSSSASNSNWAVEPSYVIRRFLDAARVPHLVAYLEALHAAGRASSEHTTLLLNAYTKLRAPDKLRAFIRGGPGAGGGAGGSGSITFDVRVAIGVLREAGCLPEAIFLAEKHDEHDAYVQLLLEASAGGGGGEAEGAVVLTGGVQQQQQQQQQASPSASLGAAPAPIGSASASSSGAVTAISFIRRLPFAEAEAAARRYGRALLAAAPGPATDLLCDLCAGFVRQQPYVGAAPVPGAPAGGKASRGGGDKVDPPDGLLPLFSDSPFALKAFTQFLVGKAARRELPQPSPTLWHSLIEVSLLPPPGAPSSTPQAQSPTPLALSLAEDARRDAEVLTSVLKDPTAAYEPHAALALCQRAGYVPGVLYLYERLRMTAAVLAHYMDVASAAHAAGRVSEAKAARRELVRKAKAFADAPPGPDRSGPAGEVQGGQGAAGQGDNGHGGSGGGGGSATDVSLWVPVLQYLTRTYGVPAEGGSGVAAAAKQPLPPLPALTRSGSTGAGVGAAPVPGRAPGGGGALGPLDDQDTLLMDVLRHIDRSGALQPLTVVSILSANPAVPFGAVREFVVRRLGADGARLEEERRVVESLRADTLLMMDETRRLETQPLVFQSRKCRACGGDLELPSVHFPCGALLGEEHSFHAHCVLGDATLAGGGAGGGGGPAGGGGGMSLECPVCAGDHRTVREFRASLGGGVGPGGGARLAESFYHELSQSADGFSKCAEYFSKGVFDANNAVTAP